MSASRMALKIVRGGITVVALASIALWIYGGTRREVRRIRSFLNNAVVMRAASAPDGTAVYQSRVGTNADPTITIRSARADQIDVSSDCKRSHGASLDERHRCYRSDRQSARSPPGKTKSWPPGNCHAPPPPGDYWPLYGFIAPTHAMPAFDPLRTFARWVKTHGCLARTPPDALPAT
jgi:hypothetical protein